MPWVTLRHASRLRQQLAPRRRLSYVLKFHADLKTVLCLLLGATSEAFSFTAAWTKSRKRLEAFAARRLSSGRESQACWKARLNKSIPAEDGVRFIHHRADFLKWRQQAWPAVRFNRFAAPQGR
jgi:hypothetical protein